MKRFYKDAAAAAVEGGWQVRLDGRGVKTPAGAPQVVPTRALAEALAAEWAVQDGELDPARFGLRDLADIAVDSAADEARAAILPYGETDTLLYRALPSDPLAAAQEAAWDPIVAAAEARLGVRFVRVAGVLHRAQPDAAQAALTREVEALRPFALTAVRVMAALAASLIVALTALEPDADLDALWDAAELEEAWQAERWGQDAEAAARAAGRRAAFMAAARFARLAREEPRG
ncbi:ATP12 family protein [Parablastomonas sp. CN1-191]|uniref:ATP12 family protein n=1 Tax=Parablastomonas sp. CN1-191 TaxID=3400908 RepID=UPI003BF7A095